MTFSGNIVHTRTLLPPPSLPSHSLALHPNKTLVATAQIGKDPYICVWDSVTMETVSILQGGHQRGIATICFSGDGEVCASCPYQA